MDKDAGADLSLNLRGLVDPIQVSGRVLTADEMNTRNTFENPNDVEPVAFNDFNVDGYDLDVSLPSKSVTVLKRSEERRVGKECRGRGSEYNLNETWVR